MKRYAAIHNVTVAGRLFTHGEIISAELTAGQRERLLRIGAIRVMMEVNMSEQPHSAPEDDDPMDVEDGGEQNDSLVVDEAEDEAEEETEDESTEDIRIDAEASIVDAPRAAPQRTRSRKAREDAK